MWLLLLSFRQGENTEEVSLALFLWRWLDICIIFFTKWGLNCSKMVPWCRCDSNHASFCYCKMWNLWGFSSLSDSKLQKQDILLKLIFTVHICVSVRYLSHDVKGRTLKLKNMNKIFTIWTVKKNKTQQLNSKFSELLRRRLDIILSQFHRLRTL